MIVSFGNKETRSIWRGESVPKLPVHPQQITRRKLRMLNNSNSLLDLRIPPSNRLERLHGDFKEYYSIRVNRQYRIIFKWANGMATVVELVDYH